MTLLCHYDSTLSGQETNGAMRSSRISGKLLFFISGGIELIPADHFIEGIDAAAGYRDITREIAQADGVAPGVAIHLFE